MTLNIERTIILIGTGRCGSSALHALLSMHPQLAWLSGLCDRFPQRPQYNRWLMHAFDLPFIANHLHRKFEPGENYLFWAHYAPSFRRPFRDLTAQDVTTKEKKSVSQVMAKMLTSRRNRLLIKVTGWPRIGYLQEIFGDAKFIHIMRDGRAVANSLIAVDFWDGWLGPERWRWGHLSADHFKAWEASGKSFIGLAGLEWVIMQEAVIKAKSLLNSEDFLEIRYEDFCEDKSAAIKQITQFGGLDWSSEFENFVRAFEVKNQNFRWKKDLTIEQQGILENIEYEYLKKFGYLP